MDSAPLSPKCSQLLSSGHILTFFPARSLGLTLAIAFTLTAVTSLYLSEDI